MIVMKADEDVRHPYGGQTPFLGCAIEDDGHPFGHCQSIIIWKLVVCVGSSRLEYSYGGRVRTEQRYYIQYSRAGLLVDLGS